MKHRVTKQDLAITAAVKLIDALIYNYFIDSEFIFDFLDTEDDYKGLLNNTDLLVKLLEDNSMGDFVQELGEAINNKYYVCYD